ncbi:hypothetical protein EC968_008591 [Mortierella alpina]|nr:hypothetical protein EC968_008591 [Mortierella alpina]
MFCSKQNFAQGEPQVEIIMQGLPLDCQEEDIRVVIEQEDIGLDTIRIAKDHNTGNSKGYGFLRFMTIQHAQDFIRLRSPSIRIGSNWVRIAYSNNPSSSRDFSRRCNGCSMVNDVHSKNCPQYSSSKQAPACGPAIETDSKNVILTISYPTYARHYLLLSTRHIRQNLIHIGKRLTVSPFDDTPTVQRGYLVLRAQCRYDQSQPAVLNVGARDIGSVPNSILVVTDLPSMVSESGLWNAMATLGPLVRVMLAKDRQSRISWGFCFAEYADVKSAAIALDRAESGSFTIQRKPVEVHYAHHGSFIPAYAPTQWTISYGSEGQLAIYWDEQAFLSVYSDPSAAKLSSKAIPDACRSTPKAGPKDELAAFYAAMGDVLKSEPQSKANGALFSVPAVSASSTNSSVPTPAPIAQDLPALPTTAKMDKVQLAGIAAAQAAEQLAKTEDKKRKAGQVSSIGIGGGGKKSIDKAFFAWQVSIQLQKWSTKQVELQSSDAPTAAPQPVPEFAPPSFSQPTQSQELQDFTKYEPDELLDFKLTACLLCQRRLKTLQDLRKHQELSDLHKKNLQDPQAVQNALKKSRGISSTGSGTTAQSESRTADANLSGAVTTPDEEPKYRDRAAERRQIFGQPDYPLPPTPSGRDRDYGGGGGGGRFGGGGRALGGGGGFQHDVVIPEQPTKDGIKEDNIGNRLLKSMGWKEGQGLGKDGAGIKAPIEASGYAKGVGIGAGLARKADGSSSLRGPLGNYAESVKELARRRYEQSE